MMDNATAIDDRLKALGISLGTPPKPGGSYVAVNIRANIAYVAIQFPIAEGKFVYPGRIGRDITTEQGYEAAKAAAINVLNQIKEAVGFEKILGLNHLDIYFQADDNWDEGPKVANGASDLFLAALGDRGKHTRAIMGVHKLSRGHCVAVVASFTVKE
jgi:enamine deaminase RidA (YjgF/YER057c/UK114 family)